jgi:hypothetical protein
VIGGIADGPAVEWNLLVNLKNYAERSLKNPSFT